MVELHRGYFEPWLRDAGRPDLAEAAARVRLTDIASAPALEQFLQAATLIPPGRRRTRGRAASRAAGGGQPSREVTPLDAAPNEANGPPEADPPSVTRLTPEEAQRVFPKRLKLTDELAREVTRLYAETDTPVEAIARQFSISQASVYRLAQRPGVPVRQATAASAPSRARTPVGDGRRRGRRAGARAWAETSVESDGGRAPGTSTAVQRTPRRRRTAAGPSAVMADDVASAPEPSRAMAEFGYQPRSGGVGRR